ncbi:MAG: cytochrome c3 family protein [Nitrospirota bacterium]|nr:MAG: cytochrome c3 family protein [Nitrospirota bacterium]
MKKKGAVLLITLLSCIFVTLSYAEINSPSSVVLDSMVDQYSAVTFDHDMHSSIAESCVQCHHEHPVSDVHACGQCHSITAQDYRRSVANAFMACENCHGEYDKNDPGRPGLKVALHRTCFECHQGLGNLGHDPKGCVETCHSKR